MVLFEYIARVYPQSKYILPSENLFFVLVGMIETVEVGT
jgi:hypothetical protein